jgi:hypothetical protein
MLAVLPYPKKLLRFILANEVLDINNQWFQ